MVELLERVDVALRCIPPTDQELCGKTNRFEFLKILRARRKYTLAEEEKVWLVFWLFVLCGTVLPGINDRLSQQQLVVEDSITFLLLLGLLLLLLLLSVLLAVFLHFRLGWWFLFLLLQRLQQGLVTNLRLHTFKGDG